MLMKFVLPREDIERVVLGYLKKEHDVDPKELQIAWDGNFQMTVQTKSEPESTKSWLDIKE